MAKGRSGGEEKEEECIVIAVWGDEEMRGELVDKREKRERDIDAVKSGEAGGTVEGEQGGIGGEVTEGVMKDREKVGEGGRSGGVGDDGGRGDGEAVECGIGGEIKIT